MTIDYTEYSLHKGQRSINSVNIAMDIWLNQIPAGAAPMTSIKVLLVARFLIACCCWGSATATASACAPACGVAASCSTGVGDRLGHRSRIPQQAPTWSASPAAPTSSSTCSS